MPITLKTKTVFHCVCGRPECKHEWDAFTKPQRCAKCKYRTWNGEDYRSADPFDGVPFVSQIENGQKAPPLPAYLPMLTTLTAARAIVARTIENGKRKREANKLKEVLANLDSHIDQLNALRPLRSTYLKSKRNQKLLPEQVAQ